ncbi:YfhO family protein [Streptomyces sp. 8N616]|uniref:YfhO family protein n=1 Tax=Streptomyces sp. 8N616 TaxID=3457414 RepID=UPI003FD1B02E
MRAARGIRGVRRFRGAALGAAVAMAAFVVSGAVRGTYPFGGRSRAVNDLGNQFVPFHAHLWDLLHGTSSGDLFFNWNSAFGVPYWAEFTSFLGNPFSLLVALFPRRLVDLGVYTGEVLSIGLGAAVMALWLRRLKPGAWWQTGLLGAAYGLSGWTLSDGTPDPMWLWGLTALPLMLLALDRCTRDRGWLWAAPMVGLAWAGNFYTAMMAALGTALVGIVLLATRAWSRGERLRFVRRAAVAFALGTALAAPAYLPAYLASGNAVPLPALPFHRPRLLEYALQLLPAQRAFGGFPRFFAGMLVLLLVLAFPLSRRIPARTRAGWCAALLAVAASFCWLPTVKLWHGLSQPNGSPYRAAFVLTGLLVSVAWLCLAHRPGPRPLLAAGAAACALAALSAHHENGVGPLTWLVVLGSGGVTLGLLLVLPRTGGRTAPPVLAAAITVVVFAESAASAVAVDEQRNTLRFFAPKPTWGARHDAVREALDRTRGWPDHRTDTGPADIVNNDPQLLGSEGPAYYSSYVPKRTARLMQRLGYAWTMHGRHVMGQSNPAADAVFAIGARVRHAPGSERASAVRFPAPPLVTVHPRKEPRLPADASAFAHQQAALGHEVYELPRISINQVRSRSWITPPRLREGGPYRLAAGGSPYRIRARCTPGRRLYVHGPWTDARLAGPGGKTVRLWGDYPANASAAKPLGTVPASGRVTVTVSPFEDTELPTSPLGCLDTGGLRRAVAELRATGATRVEAGGHTLRATLPAGSSATAVVATAPTPGWQCSVGGSPARSPESRLGLLAVPLPPGAGPREISCSFRPPGLRLAGVTSASAAAVLLLAMALSAARRRRAAGNGRGQGAPPSPGTAPAARPSSPTRPPS